jgi:hypothetical protein
MDGLVTSCFRSIYLNETVSFLSVMFRAGRTTPAWTELDPGPARNESTGTGPIFRENYQT